MEKEKEQMKISNPKNKYHSTLFTCLLFLLMLILLPILISLSPSHLLALLNQHSFLFKLLFIVIALSYAFLIRKPIEPILVNNDNTFLLSGFSSVFDIIGFQTVNGYDQKLTHKYYYNFNAQPMDNLGLPDLYKSLNLPVRSLKSKVVENCFREETETNTTRLVRFCEENKKVEILGLIPINLEKKFEEAAALPSPVPWSSRPSMVELGNKLKPHSHKKLLSVGFNEIRPKEARLCARSKVGTVVGNVGFSSLGDFEVENLDSRSILNTRKMVMDRVGSELNEHMGKQTSLTQTRAVHANQAGIMKVQSKVKQLKVGKEKRNASSSSCLRPSSVDDLGNKEKKLEAMIGQMETRGKEGYATSLSQSDSFWSSIFSPINSGSPSPKNTSHLFPIITENQNPELEDLMKEKNLERTWDITLKTFNKSNTIEENREKMQPATPTKSLLSGKSVRTNKSHLVDTRREEIFLGHMDENFKKSRSCNLENISLDESSKSVDRHNDKRYVTSRSSKTHTKKESFGDTDNFKENFDEKTDSASADNEEVDNDEVDKKADAFIAKFREQIRLQKIDYVRRKC